METGAEFSKELVELGIRYFRGYPRKIHHPREDLIYGALPHHVQKHSAIVFIIIEDQAISANALSSLMDGAAC